MERITIEKLPSVQNEEQKRHLIRYVNFINSRPERKLKQKGFHTHHIYPRSMAIKNNIEDYDGGWNLIELTHREHFIAHMILFYCGYKEMILAFWYMINSKSEKYISSKQYEYFKIKFVDFKSKDNSDRIWINNGFIEKFIKNEELYNYKDFLTGRLKRINYLNHRGTKGKIWINNKKEEMYCVEEHIHEYLNNGWNKGRLQYSEERCLNMRNGKKDMIHIYKNNKNKIIKKDVLNEYLNDGWVVGTINMQTTKNRTRMSLENKIVYVLKEDVEEYIKNGYVIGYNEHTFPKNSKAFKKIKCVETGDIFNFSIDVVNKFKGIISQSSIIRSLKLGKTIKNYTFIYI